MPEVSEEEQRKLEERERKKAEVRQRLEAASKAAKKDTKKGGFMTPERKKKLRVLLRAKAAEELKKEQERKAAQRKATIAERCGNQKSLDGANEATLQAICREYHARIVTVESDKYDLEFQVRLKDYQINELNIQVNDLRGKFVKPALKKVSKFDKIKIMQTKQSEVDFRAGLKTVKKEFKELTDTKGADKPEWSLGGKKEEHVEGEAAEE